MNLRFYDLKKANIQRCEETFKHSVYDWSVEKWTIAFAGEAGEVCDAVKKLMRHQDGTNTEKDPQTESACVAEIAKELADAVIYADLLATKLGLSLEDCVKDKFNQVSIARFSEVLL